MTTRDSTGERPRPEDAQDWVNLRGDRGQIQGRLNRRTGKLVIVERGVLTEHDLRKLLTYCESPESVLG